MSIQGQKDTEALSAKVSTHQSAIVEIAYDVSQLKAQVEELTKLLRAMTRESTPRGKAA